MVAFAIVCIYLGITLAIGLIMKRRAGKDKTIRDFFVANGSMSLPLISIMLFGDIIAASTTTGTAGTGYSTGMAAVWGIWGSSLGCIVFSVFFCKFFFEIRKTGAITGPEAFGMRFDSKIRFLILVFTLIPLFIVLSTQITATCMYLNSMLGFDDSACMAIVFALFLSMALLGITGIAEMNKVHSFVLFFGLIFTAVVCVNHIGGPQVIFEKLPPSYFNPFVNGVFTVIAQFVGGALGFSISVTSINIAYCARDIRVAKTSHIIVAAVCAFFAFVPLTIGLCAAVSMDGIRPDNALYGMTSVVSPELAGLAVMAVLAAILSTAPWFLLAISKLVVQNMVTPAYEAMGGKLGDRSALWMSRAIVVIALIIGMAISGTNSSLLNSLMSASQIKSIAVILLLFGIYWKRTSNTAGFAGLLVGGALSTIWYVLGNPFDIQPFWPGVLSSTAIIVFGSLYVGRGRGSVSPDYVAYKRRLVESQQALKE